jgi:hypothetical protein
MLGIEDYRVLLVAGFEVEKNYYLYWSLDHCDNTPKISDCPVETEVD